MKLFLGCLLFFLSAVLHAQIVNCVVKGTVLDCNTKEPIAFAAVYNSTNKTTGTLTNELGQFEIKVDTNADITINFLGYTNKVLNVTKDNLCGRTLEVCLEEERHFDIWPPMTPPVIVEGFRNKRTIESTPAAIGLVNAKSFLTTDQTSLQNTVNTIPGVIMEQRGYGGSHRISIRGSALRAPFAVRNVKMYIDGIALTSPDGQSPLELIDVADIASLEIIKGPAGSVWGSGNGGVLYYTSNKAAPNQTILKSSAQLGSYNLARVTSAVEVGLNKGGIRVSQVYQDNAGYRVQEFNHKNQISLIADYKLNEKNKFNFYATYYNARWGLPGGLKAIEADTLPTQAVKYSWLNNANVARKRTMAGAAHTHRFNDSGMFSVTTSAYFYTTDKTNPYGTSNFNNGYKNEDANGAGARMDWSLLQRHNNWWFKYNWGGEFQYEKYHIDEYSLLSGQPNNFKYLYDVQYASGMAFASADASYKNILFLNAGVSVNNTPQKVNGLNAAGFEFDTTAVWNSKLLPRIAASIMVLKGIYAYASLSYGNSNPTVFEMIDYENNAYNLNLKPEFGRNTELGVKGNISNMNLRFEANVYSFELSDFIYQRTENIPVADSLIEIIKFENAGSASQRGLEWSINKLFKFTKIPLECNAFASGSVFKHKFLTYTNDAGSYGGKRLPGVPLSNVVVGANFTFMQKFGVSVTHYWMDRVPLNNDNTQWSAAYNLSNVSANYDFKIIESMQVKLYAGMNNVLDTKYTSYFSTNASANKFYNPAPPRNYFGGLSFTWKIK